MMDEKETIRNLYRDYWQYMIAKDAKKLEASWQRTIICCT